jgi:hypothetical protein
VVKIIATFGASVALFGCGGTPNSFGIIPVETTNTAPLISEITDKALCVLGKLPTIPLEVSVCFTASTIEHRVIRTR